LHEALELHHADMILGSEHEETLQHLKPELLVSFGGPVISKNLKTFLRNHKPPAHWHIQPHGECIDAFQSLTQIVPVCPEYFFENLLRIFPKMETSFGKDYAGAWRRLESKAANSLRAFLLEAPHGEFTAIHSVLKALPRDSRLQLGNSGIVRFASFLSLTETNGVKVNSNRGTSGIDGTVSTAVGAALATPLMTTLITGDLAFFYDRNALWHNYLPANLRIVVINNYGGGIFRILDGASDLPELTQHFEVEHQLTAKNTAADHGLDYVFCDSAQSLAAALPKFFEPKNRPAILEIHTNKNLNHETFLKFRSIMREIS
jgi:2-succinyl-5-enolpyruvyl-6-hydroxy-3-cyclohexene-1-carboxylate synthase